MHLSLGEGERREEIKNEEEENEKLSGLGRSARLGGRANLKLIKTKDLFYLAPQNKRRAAEKRRAEDDG